MAKKLSKMDKLALEILANWRISQGASYLRMPHQERLVKLLDLGYIEQVENTAFRSFRITPAGAAAIGRADLFAQPATVTAQATFGVGSDADLLDEDVYIDEPLPYVRDGGSRAAADETDNFYLRKQSELEALRQENAKLMRSEDAYRQENERLRAALMPFAELWTKFVSDYEQEFVSYNPAEPKDDDWFVGGKRTYYGHRLDPLIFKSAFEALTEPVAPGDGGE